MGTAELRQADRTGTISVEPESVAAVSFPRGRATLQVRATDAEAGLRARARKPAIPLVRADQV